MSYRSRRWRTLGVALVSHTVLACSEPTNSEPFESGGSTGSTGASGVPGDAPSSSTSDNGSPTSAGNDGPETMGADTSGAGTGEPLFDVGGGRVDMPAQCPFPPHDACDGDAGGTDLFRAMGLGCPGELQVTATSLGGLAGQATRTGFGANATFAPREGARFAVIGTGNVGELDLETPPDDGIFPTFCDDWVPDSPNSLSGPIPAPIVGTAVDGDCVMDPALVGTGDCSGSLEEQFAPIEMNGYWDYQELRVTVEVPEGITSFSFDSAFVSTEYPVWVDEIFNDTFLVWLDSEGWSGNIAFDSEANPITVNSGFFDLGDDAGTLDEFEGTCMRRHGGISWLRTSAPVVPGETITLVFAIFDISDSGLDSFAFIDNFQWGCDDDLMPQTEPEG
jgi:hypothetical protein